MLIVANAIIWWLLRHRPSLAQILSGVEVCSDSLKGTAFHLLRLQSAQELLRKVEIWIGKWSHPRNLHESTQETRSVHSSDILLSELGKIQRHNKSIIG